MKEDSDGTDKENQGKIVATDIDNDELTYTVAKQSENGTVTIDEKTGEYTYAPKSDFNGKEEFTVLVDDGNGGRVEIIVPVTVTPVNDAPSLENDEVTVSQSLKTGSEVYDINDSKTGNDFDIDGDEITYEIISGNTSGLFVIDPATGKITITPGKTLDSVATPEGGYKLTIKGTDSSDEKLTDESVITIKVDGESSKITTSIESMGKIEGETFGVNKGPVILKITGTDQDGQPISFTREVELTRPDGSGTGTYTYQITKDDGIAEGSSVNVEAQASLILIIKISMPMMHCLVTLMKIIQGLILKCQKLQFQLLEMQGR